MRNIFILASLIIAVACEQSAPTTHHREEKVDAIITHVFDLKKTNERTIQSEKTPIPSDVTINKKL